MKKMLGLYRKHMEKTTTEGKPKINKELKEMIDASNYFTLSDLKRLASLYNPKKKVGKPQ